MILILQHIKIDLLYIYLLHLWCNGLFACLKYGRLDLWNCTLPRSNQRLMVLNIYFCSSTKHAALRSMNKDWMAPNQNDESEWGDMFTHKLLFQ